jgi:hypothetical protein
MSPSRSLPLSLPRPSDPDSHRTELHCTTGIAKLNPYTGEVLVVHSSRTSVLAHFPCITLDSINRVLTGIQNTAGKFGW